MISVEGRVGNNVGVESGGVDAVFVDRPVMLFLLLFPAQEESEDATFLAEPRAHTSSVASTRAYERSLSRHTTAQEVC